MLLLGITGVVEGITMSVEKLSDLSKVYVEKVPYTQIFNTIIDDIKDNDAFRLYTYLASKSRDWTVVKEWSAKQCGVGERKAKQCWSYLERCGLLEYVQIRNEIGKFTKHDMRVLNGSKFNPNEPFMKASGAVSAPVESYPQSHRCNNPPSGESTRVGFAPLLNKDLTNKDFDTKKSFCDRSSQKAQNEKKHSWAEPQKPVMPQPPSAENYKPAPSGKLPPTSLLKEFMEKSGIVNDTDKLSPRTEIQPEISTRNEPGVQGAAIDARGHKSQSPPIRAPHRVLEARSACSYLEAFGLANPERGSEARMGSG